MLKKKNGIDTPAISLQPRTMRGSLKGDSALEAVENLSKNLRQTLQHLRGILMKPFAARIGCRTENSGVDGAFLSVEALDKEMLGTDRNRKFRTLCGCI